MPGLPLRSLPDLVLELRRGESMTISIVQTMPGPETDTMPPAPRYQPLSPTPELRRSWSDSSCTGSAHTVGNRMLQGNGSPLAMRGVVLLGLGGHL
jgi:hypothetical protein